MTTIFAALFAASEETVTTVAEPPSLGAVIIAVAAAAILVWMTYLVIGARRRAQVPEDTPKNLQQYLSDDELESNRLTGVLGSAVVVAAVLALTMPIYYFNEPGRQETAAHEIEESYIEEGEHWYEFFSCINCHGPAGVGGAATYIEARSDLDVAWSVPSLNDVFYRYSEDEVRFWIVYGRQGTPMPAAGLEGGGAMTSQEIDQTLAYLRSIQLSQAEVLAESTPAVASALNRHDNGLTSVQTQIMGDAATGTEGQQQVVESILDAPAIYDQLAGLPGRIKATLTDPGICTDKSAALYSVACRSDGVDTDRDGVSDEAERALTSISGEAFDVLRRSDLLYLFDPGNAFTTEVGGEPIGDLESADTFRNDVDTSVLSFRVIADRQSVFLERAESGLEYLNDSLATEKWMIDFDAIADAAFDGDVEVARRAAGLFNAYCARCHTGGYSAGVAFEQGAGSGAWAPALTDQRSVVQFPNIDDQIAFIIKGSELATNYGVNGLGRGWMPGFGQSLTREEIELIVKFERAL